MSDISPLKKMIQVEEARYPAAASESFASRVGSSINFIKLYQLMEKEWVLDGRYVTDAGPQTSVDGAIPIGRDLEIVGFFMYSAVAGSSGSTEIDIKRHTTSGSAGSSIFTVRPQISFTAGNNAFLMVWFNPAETLSNPSGTTLPTLPSYNLDKGDALTLDFVGRQLNGESLTVSLMVRPR